MKFRLSFPILKSQSIKENLEMKKFVLIYEDNTKSVNHRFFQSIPESIPFSIGVTYFQEDDCSDDDFPESEEYKFLEKLDIEFEPKETILILEIPEEFKII